MNIDVIFPILVISFCIFMTGMLFNDAINNNCISSKRKTIVIIFSIVLLIFLGWFNCIIIKNNFNDLIKEAYYNKVEVKVIDYNINGYQYNIKDEPDSIFYIKK